MNLKLKNSVKCSTKCFHDAIYFSTRGFIPVILFFIFSSVFFDADSKSEFRFFSVAPSFWVIGKIP